MAIFKTQQWVCTLKQCAALPPYSSWPCDCSNVRPSSRTVLKKKIGLKRIYLEERIIHQNSQGIFFFNSFFFLASFFYQSLAFSFLSVRDSCHLSSVFWAELTLVFKRRSEFQLLTAFFGMVEREFQDFYCGGWGSRPDPTPNFFGQEKKNDSPAIEVNLEMARPDRAPLSTSPKKNTGGFPPPTFS